MNINQLKLFTTVAQYESISKAAKILRVSQPSISKNIAKLEEELSTPLFVRGSRKMTLTPQGAHFNLFCAQMLSDLDRTISEMSQQNSSSDKRIKISTTGNCQKIIDCVAAYSREHPGSEFDINTMIESEGIPDINSFDVIVYPDDTKYEKYKGYHLCTEQCFLAVPASDVGRLPGVITSKTLDGLNVVFLHPSGGYAEHAHRVCASLAVKFASQCFADSRLSRIQMIASGIAVGFVLEGEAAAYRTNPEIKLLPIIDDRFSRRMMICFRREKHLSETALNFKRFAVSYFDIQE